MICFAFKQLLKQQKTAYQVHNFGPTAKELWTMQKPFTLYILYATKVAIKLINFTSGKHAYIILTPLNPTFI